MTRAEIWVTLDSLCFMLFYVGAVWFARVYT